MENRGIRNEWEQSWKKYREEMNQKFQIEERIQFVYKAFSFTTAICQLAIWRVFCLFYHTEVALPNVYFLPTFWCDTPMLYIWKVYELTARLWSAAEKNW